MNATHHSQQASNARSQHRCRTLIANAPFLALIPFVVVTFYPPAFSYANEVYRAVGFILGFAISELAWRWLATSKSIKNKNS